MVLAGAGHRTFHDMETAAVTIRLDPQLEELLDAR